jgi:hypothetical protein
MQSKCDTGNDKNDNGSQIAKSTKDAARTASRL